MWKIMTCAQQGKGHIAENIPCQDKTYSIQKNNVHVIALADGAGSANLSHLGAQNITISIAKYFTEFFDRIVSNRDGVVVKKEILFFLREQLFSLAEKENCEIKDLACTLLVVAVKENRFVLCHIGDGVIGCIRDGKLIVISTPDNGEFINTTCFVTSSKALQAFVLKGGLLNNISAFVMMSDGAAESFYNRRTKMLSTILIKITSWISLLDKEKMQEMLEQSFKETIIPKTTDDCSIAFLVNTSDAYQMLLSLDTMAMLDLLGYSSKASFKRIKKIKKLFYILTSPLSNLQIAQQLNIHGPGKKHVGRFLAQLVDSGVLIKKDALYQLAVLHLPEEHD